jgi:tRNA(Ile)-lysidine synthase
LIAPLGTKPASALAETSLGDAPRSLVRAALAAEPAIYASKNTRDPEIAPLPAPWAKFLPSFDLAAAKAVTRLIGAPAAPPPPFAGHNTG